MSSEAAEAVSEPTTDQIISATVEAMAAAQGTSFTKILTECGIPLATSSRRRNRGGWTAVEVAVVAKRIGISINDIYAGRIPPLGRAAGGSA